MTVARIVPALLLPGAALLPEGQKGLSETYRGPIETAAGKTFAYVKLVDVKELINELVSSVLGRTLGLPIPPGFIVLVNRDDYPESEFLLTRGQDKALAFGVESVGHPDLKRRIRIEGESVMRELLRTWTGWCDAMTFDEWIANVDRNQGNLLIGAPGEVWLIDHGQAFTGPNWTPSDLDPVVAVQNQIASVIAPHLALPERHRALRRATEVSQECRKVDADEVLKEGFTAALASDAEIQALGNFIAKRVDELVRLISMRVGLPVLPI
jgi:hypothetical protein